MKFLGSATLAVLLSVAALVWAPVRAEEPLFAGLDTPIADIVKALREAKPIGLKPVGTTSVVFKMDLEGPVEAAFKPRTKDHPKGYLAEVAAFRIARVLGLDNVAPAVPRTLRIEQMKALLGAEQAARWDELFARVLPRGEEVDGVAIYWIPDMHELGLDTKDGVQRWARWLAQHGDAPSREKSKLIAAQVSTVIGFDYLIGNWDRWSGANAQGDHSERRLFVRDHNVAFFEPLPRALHERTASRLKRVERFSRSFVDAVKALDEARLRKGLTDPSDPPGFVALDDGQLAAVLDRRRALLSYMAAVIDRYGESAVLTFP